MFTLCDTCAINVLFWRTVQVRIRSPLNSAVWTCRNVKTDWATTSCLRLSFRKALGHTCQRYSKMILCEAKQNLHMLAAFRLLCLEIHQGGCTSASAHISHGALCFLSLSEQRERLHWSWQLHLCDFKGTKLLQFTFARLDECPLLENWKYDSDHRHSNNQRKAAFLFHTLACRYDMRQKIYK